MNTPEDEIRFAEAFSELGEAAELMVEPPTVGAIRGKVRRRRVARVTVAAVAAVALAAPATWMLQQVATAKEGPQIADDVTVETTAPEDSVPSEVPSPTDDATSEGEEQMIQSAPPTFDELVGTTLDLPSFIPDAGIDEICRGDAAVLEDGRTGGYMDENGRIGLLEVVHAPIVEGGRQFPVLLLGCRFAEAAAYQVVVLDESESTGEWYVGWQFTHSVMNADRPYDIAPAPGHGVLVGVAEHFACCDMIPDEFEYWIEKFTLDAGEPVSERLGEGALPDLTVEVVATEEDAAANRWTVSVLVVNEGDAPSGTYLLSVCGDPAEVQADFTLPDCQEAGSVRIETIEPLEVGEEASFSWEVTLAPPAERVGNTYLQFSVEPDAVGAAGIVRDGRFENNSGFYAFE